RQSNQDDQYPGISLAVVPLSRACDGSAIRNPQSAIGPVTAGPWSHVAPPAEIPAWIDCTGFSGVLAYSHRRPSATDVDTHLLVRAVAMPDSPRPGYAVVVDLLINDAVREQLRSETGVALKNII